MYGTPLVVRGGGWLIGRGCGGGSGNAKQIVNLHIWTFGQYRASQKEKTGRQKYFFMSSNMLMIKELFNVLENFTFLKMLTLFNICSSSKE